MQLDFALAFYKLPYLDLLEINNWIEIYKPRYFKGYINLCTSTNCYAAKM